VRPIVDRKFDFVIGSRTRGVREPVSMGAHQALAGRLIGWVVGIFYGVRYTDMCAFRAIRSDILVRHRVADPQSTKSSTDRCPVGLQPTD
jgi:hypothetical protein